MYKNIKCHYSLRKLTVGFASVLIGTSLYFGSSTNHVLADENVNATADQITAQSDKTVGKVASNVSTSKSASNQVESDQSTDENNIGQDDEDVQVYEINSGKVEDYRKAVGLDGKDALTDQQLKDLGIDHATYLHDGVKYKAEAHIDIAFSDNKKMDLGSYNPYHKANGDLDKDRISNLMPLIEDKNGVYVNEIHDYVALAPYLTGGTIYINKGHELGSQDLDAGYNTLPDKDVIISYVWDKELTKVDINKSGSYSAAIDVTFKNNVTTSAGITVVVKDEVPVQPTEPIESTEPIPDPTPEPTAPSTPVEPEQPTTPTNVQPLPQTPTEPTSDADTVKPLPQKVEKHENKKVNKTNEKPKAKITKSDHKVKEAVHKVQPTVVHTSVRSIRKDKVVNANVKAKAQLPQTGEQNNPLVLIGMAFASLAGLLVLASNRKHNN